VAPTLDHSAKTLPRISTTSDDENDGLRPAIVGTLRVLPIGYYLPRGDGRVRTRRSLDQQFAIDRLLLVGSMLLLALAADRHRRRYDTPLAVTARHERLGDVVARTLVVKVT
jgi:hypothetical protein